MIQTPVIVHLCQPEGRSRKDHPLRHLRQLPGGERRPGGRHRLRLPALHHEVPQGRHQDATERNSLPYEVWSYEPNDNNAMTSLVEKLHNDPEIDVVLIDSPEEDVDISDEAQSFRPQKVSREPKKEEEKKEESEAQSDADASQEGKEESDDEQGAIRQLRRNIQ